MIWLICHRRKTVRLISITQKDGYYAAIKFGGYANDNKIEKKIGELKEILAYSGYPLTGGCTYLGYNAPWDLVGRENEIIVPIKYMEKAE